MNRRDFLYRTSLGLAGTAWLGNPLDAQGTPGFRLVDVTKSSGLTFTHNNGAFGGKFLPETLGSGCAFIDYDADGWPDILLVNGSDWPGHRRRRTTLALYRNNRNGTFTDVTKAAGLDIEMYGMGVAVGDYNNDGFPDIFITAVGQSRLFRNTGKGTFVDVTTAAGLGKREAFSTSAMWVDIDRDGHLDLFVCNYVRWTPEQDVFCSLDGKQKSYCTPEAYRGATCWLFRNRGNGTFEDITANCGIFDSNSKALGVALIDDDQDGWPDLLVANDTEPNKLYRNLKNGKFRDVGLAAGLALSEDGKARAGMGIDAADFDNSGRSGIAVTNFEGEMIGLYRSEGAGRYRDVATRVGVGAPSKNRLGFGCLFGDLDLDGDLDLVVVNGHIDDTVRNIPGNVGYAQPPHLFLNDRGAFRDVAAQVGGGFEQPRVGRGLAFGDFDNDGDLDVLITTNNGPAVLFRNDRQTNNRSVRFTLTGVTSNRDAIGATVRITHGGITQTRMVRSGSSYLSQSELPVTFGVGTRDLLDRVVITWPNGRVDDFTNVATGLRYHVREGGTLERA
ncbi:MAG: CRTAC1 family protein [Vicinamibacterales bacterium]